MPYKTALSIILWAAASAAQSAVIYFDPASQTANVGDEASVSLKGAEFDKTIEGGGINLSFDPAILQLKTVTIDTQTWEFFTTPGTIDNTGGSLANLTFSSFAGRNNSFAIAQITFQAIGAGISPLSLSESALNPFASGGELLTPAVNFLSAEIKAVPLPASVWLFLSSLGSFLLSRKKVVESVVR